MKEYGYTGAWDIEDLVTLGKRVKACPFYATRALLDEAEIVFCPYNYLISSLIRQQLRINLQSSVLIFDEAHNMEDVARDAASLTVSSLQLKELQDELHKITQMIPYNENYHVIMTYVYHILNWMTSTANDFMPRGISDTCSIWSGSDFKPHLKTIGITPETSQKIMETSGYLKILYMVM
jgi:Fanconi anemia group J protein